MYGEKLVLEQMEFYLKIKCFSLKIVIIFNLFFRIFLGTFLKFFWYFSHFFEKIFVAQGQIEAEGVLSDVLNFS